MSLVTDYMMSLWVQEIKACLVHAVAARQRIAGRATYLLTHRTMTVPTAIDCAASSIHHSPLSQMLPLGKDATSSPEHEQSTLSSNPLHGSSRLAL
jgi:hypothetical protein